MKLMPIDYRITNLSIEGGGDAGGGQGGGEGGGGGAAGGGEGGGDPAPYYEAFANAELKTNPTIHKFKTPEELANGYVSLEKRYGIDPARRIDLPASLDDKDGMRAVYTRLGLPEKADGYGFQLDDKATDADKAFVGRAQEHLHGLGVVPEHAKGMFEFWMKEAATAAEAQGAADAQAKTEGEARLKTEWGGAFDRYSKELGNFMLKHFGDNVAAFFTPEKLGNNADFALGLAKLMDLMAEPGSGEGRSDEHGAGKSLSPSAASAQARQLEAHPAFRDAKHPEHKDVVRRRTEFLKQADAKA